LNSRGIGAKYVKDLDDGLILEKLRGLCVNLDGILIIEELFF
jgi:hypothetical protein